MKRLCLCSAEIWDEKPESGCSMAPLWLHRPVGGRKGRTCSVTVNLPLPPTPPLWSPCLSSKLDCYQRRNPGATMWFNSSSPPTAAHPSSTLVPHSPFHFKNPIPLSSLLFFYTITHLSRCNPPLLTCQLGTGSLCACRPGQRGKRDEVQVNEKAKHKRGERLVAFQFKGSWQEGEKMAEGNRGGQNKTVFTLTSGSSSSKNNK